MRTMLATGMLCLALPAGLLAQADDAIGTQFDWGTVRVGLYPTSSLGMQLMISADSPNGIRQVHGMGEGFAPDSVFSWLNFADRVVHPTTKPANATQALLTPVLLSTSGDSIRFMRRSKGRKWDPRVTMLVDRPGQLADHFDILLRPEEATDLMSALQREAMRSEIDPDSVAALRHALAGADLPEAAVDEPPRFISAGPPHNPSPGLRGRVVMQFVVDVTGRPDPATISVILADHAVFVDSARRAVEESRFFPGRRHGVPVRVMVQQAVNFGP